MTRPARPLSQTGFTLIELMVSMAIGLLIVLALITLLINVNRNNSELSKTNRLIENGRFALQLLQADITHAGYWGGYVPQFDDMTVAAAPIGVPTAIPDPCLDYASWNVAPYTEPPSISHRTNLIGIPVQGYEIPAVVPSPTLSVCANRVTSPKARTDVLFVRHAETCVPGVGGCSAITADDVYFQTARCGSTTPDPAYVLDSNAALFNLQNRDCATTAERRKFVSNLYYIRNHAVTAGDGIPTLMRSQFGVVSDVPQHKSAEALIEGIEGFRVEYGIDNVSDSGEAVNFTAAINWADTTNLTSPRNRGDGIPDGNYIRCTTATPCTAAQLVNAVAVKLYVLVRSEKPTSGYTDSKVYCLGSNCPAATTTSCPASVTPNAAPLLGPYCDGYKRHLFTQTVRLTNVSSRRETP